MLTQLITLKTRLGLELFDNADDALLTNLLKLCSLRFAGDCHRIFDYAADVPYEFGAEQLMVVVDRPPIEVVSRFELKSSEREGWVAVEEVDYLLSPAKSIIELSEPLGLAGQLGRVIFTGGYVLPGSVPTENQVALPDDLEQVCVEQVAYWYQRRTQLGLMSVSTDGSVTQQFQTSDLLPQVTAVLKRYQRWEG